MALGFPATAARKQTGWAGAVVAFLLWTGYHVGETVVFRDTLEFNRTAAFQRLIAVCSLHSSAGTSERLLKVIPQIEWLAEMDRYCEVAVNDGDFPQQAYDDWALAHYLAGNERRAGELIAAVTEFPEIGETSMVRDYISGQKISAENLNWAETQVYYDEASWPVLHILDSGGAPDEETAWDLRRLTFEMGRRGTVGMLILYGLTAVGVICACGWIIVRKNTPLPLTRYRLPSEWSLPAIVQALFLSLLVSNLAALAISYGFAYAGGYWVGAFLSSFVFALIPPIWFSLRFSPGLGAATRLFGMGRKQASYPFAWLMVLGFGAAGVLLAVDFLIYDIISPDAVYRHPEDWLQVLWIDSPLRRYVGIFLAVIVAPFCEEWAFRGFVYGAFRTRMTPLLAAILSSTVFATVHWYSAIGWVSVFLTGLLFCWLFQRTNSLWPGILAHALFNLAVFSYMQGWYSFG